MSRWKDHFFNVPLDKKSKKHIISVVTRSIDRAHLRYTYYKNFGRPPTPEEAAAEQDQQSPARSPAFVRAINQIVGGDYNLSRRQRQQQGFYYDDDDDEDEEYEQEEHRNAGELDMVRDVAYAKEKRTPFSMEQYKCFEQMMKNAECGKPAWQKPNDGGPPNGGWTSESGRRNEEYGIPNRFVKDPFQHHKHPYMKKGGKS